MVPGRLQTHRPYGSAMSGEPVTRQPGKDPDYGQRLSGSGCPVCHTEIFSYQVDYVYKKGVQQGDENRWTLDPCGHVMTRTAWTERLP